MKKKIATTLCFLFAVCAFHLPHVKADDDKLVLNMSFTCGSGGQEREGRFYNDELAYGKFDISNFPSEQEKCDLSFSASFIKYDNPSQSFHNEYLRHFARVLSTRKQDNELHCVYCFSIPIPNEESIPPGKYIFEVTVTDSVSGRSAVLRKDVVILPKDHFGIGDFTFAKPRTTMIEAQLTSNIMPVSPLFAAVAESASLVCFSIRGFSRDENDMIDVVQTVRIYDSQKRIIMNKPLHYDSHTSDKSEMKMAKAVMTVIPTDLPGINKVLIRVEDRISGKKSEIEVPYLVVDLSEALK